MLLINNIVLAYLGNAVAYRRSQHDYMNFVRKSNRLNPRKGDLEADRIL